MTDARRFNSILSLLHSITFAEELIVVVGVVLFLGGIALSFVFAKILLFLLSGALIAYVIVRTVKRKELSAQAEESHHSLNAEEEHDNQMKKLVFDDYQASGKQYKIDFIDEPGFSQAGTP